MKTKFKHLVLACILAFAAVPIASSTALAAEFVRSASATKASQNTPVTNAVAVNSDKQAGLVVTVILPQGRSTYGIPSRRVFTLLPDTGVDRARPAHRPPIKASHPPLLPGDTVLLC